MLSIAYCEGGSLSNFSCATRLMRDTSFTKNTGVQNTG
jgi:hypothetical protein